MSWRPSSRDYLADHAEELKGVHLAGGEAAVSGQVAVQLHALFD